MYYCERGLLSHLGIVALMFLLYSQTGPNLRFNDQGPLKTAASTSSREREYLNARVISEPSAPAWR